MNYPTDIIIIYSLGMDKGRRSNQLLEVYIIIKHEFIMSIHNYYDLFPIGGYAKAEQ